LITSGKAQNEKDQDLRKGPRRQKQIEESWPSVVLAFAPLGDGETLGNGFGALTLQVAGE